MTMKDSEIYTVMEDQTTMFCVTREYEKVIYL